MIDKEIEELLNAPIKKMTTEELESFLAALDVSDPVRGVFRKYYSDEAYAKDFDDRVCARAARLCEKLK